jgi:hypothetical protein
VLLEAGDDSPASGLHTGTQLLRIIGATGGEDINGRLGIGQTR